MTQQAHIPVFYEGQDDLIDVLATSMASVCYNTSSFIDFYILDCGICKFNKKLLESMKEKFNNFSIEFIPVDLKQFEGLKGWGSGNFLDCYARLLIPELKQNLDKVIYLDSDVIAMDDINLLWEQDLEDYVYAAVPDLGYSDFFQSNCINNLGLSKEHVYPNAGVILLDTKRCREINFTKEILTLAQKEKDNILVIIEDLFSIYFGENNYKRLENRFNLTDRTNEINKTCAPFITEEYLDKEWNNIVIQHLSPGKVWQFATNTYNGKFLKLLNSFWFFAKMTPFYEGLSRKFIIRERDTKENFEKTRKKYYMLFGCFPILKSRLKGICRTYYLFGLIPIVKVKVK